MVSRAVYRLHCGDLEAAVRPDIGGSLAGLWWGGVPVLRSADPNLLDSPRQSACFALLPYSNRIGHCRFDWQGVGYATKRNFGDHPHSLHGVGWQRAWSAVSVEPSAITLALEHRPDADWPFAFSACQRLTVALHGGLASGHDGQASAEPQASLTWQLEITNIDARIQPVGLGWHPYFLRRRSHLRAAVQARWMHDDTGLPMTLAPHSSLNDAVETLSLDHCFEGWSGEAIIHDEAHTVSLRANTPRLVVFTPGGASHFCVEPVTHANNAIQMTHPQDQGLAALTPGASLSAWMRMDIRRQPSSNAAV